MRAAVKTFHAPNYARMSPVTWPVVHHHLFIFWKCQAPQYYDFYYQSSCIFYVIALVRALTPAGARNWSALRPAAMARDMSRGIILPTDHSRAARGPTSRGPGLKMVQRPNHWGKLCLNWFAFKTKSTLVIFRGLKLKSWNAYLGPDRFPNFETRCEYATRARLSDDSRQFNFLVEPR